MNQHSNATLVADADPQIVVDSAGRRISVRAFGPLDRLRLFEAAGAELARNDRWLGMAAIACAVSEIDAIPYLFPHSKATVEAMMLRLGDDGVAAVSAAIAPETPADLATAGN